MAGKKMPEQHERVVIWRKEGLVRDKITPEMAKVLSGASR
jgi:hypothetical protein